MKLRIYLAISSLIFWLSPVPLQALHLGGTPTHCCLPDGTDAQAYSSGAACVSGCIQQGAVCTHNCQLFATPTCPTAQGYTCLAVPTCPTAGGSLPGRRCPEPNQICCAPLTCAESGGECVRGNTCIEGRAKLNVQCPTSSLFPNQTATCCGELTEPAPKLVLPKLQIDLPDLKPFTLPKAKVEGEKRFLEIDFLANYLVALYRYLVGIVAIVAGGMIVWAGVKWLTSAGAPDRISDAKSKIGNALVGLVLVLGSYVILQLLNPGLVVLKPLRIEYIEREELAFANPGVGGDCSGSPGNFDTLFQNYAGCAGADWRVLRAIAEKESGLKATCVNKAGFIGLFQTKPQYCALRKFENGKFADKCEPAGLVNPAVQIAEGAIKIKPALDLVNQYCANGDIKVQTSIIYGLINTGLGGTKAALKYAQQQPGGCTADNLRRGFTEFWKNYTSKVCGGSCADWFVRYYGATRCAAYAEKRDCMGSEKYNHMFKAGEAIAAQGVTSVRQTGGSCPLNTDTPFPAS